MGLLKGLFSNLTRPYTYAIKGLAQSGRKIKEDVQSVRKTIEDKDKKQENKRWVQADNAKEAFEVLFIENEWTQEDLDKQHKMVRKSKWLMLFFVWLTFLLSLAFAVNAFYSFIDGTGYLLYSYLTMICLAICILFSLTVVKNALFQEQIERRELISLDEFLRSGEYLRKLFA